jgi:hypothetical protein
MHLRKSLGILALAVAVTAPLLAQSQPPVTGVVPKNAPGPEPDDPPHYIRKETAEQRLSRLATQEDPGVSPDPTRKYIRFGKEYHIERYDRKYAMFDVEEGWVRPFAPVNIAKEVYALNEKYVWVWVQDTKVVTEAPPTDANHEWKDYGEKWTNYFQSMRSEFQELEPPAADKTVHFEESSTGLPTAGSWRNSVAIADMNGDGFLDIIAPPERAGGNLPLILLGDGKGNWKAWDTVKWPFGLNYGSVVAGDFNHDGKMDLAFGVHLNGIWMWLGDGKGNFTDSSDGLPNDFATRRILATDVDHDGSLDIVAISEGPTSVQRDNAPRYPKVLAFLNDGKGKKWTGLQISDVEMQLGGDYLSVGNFNGDKYPDFAGASNYFNGTDILFSSQGPKKWKSVGGEFFIPYMSYYYANTIGKFSGGKYDDAIISFVRGWPTDINPKVVPDPATKQNVGLDRISFDAKGELTRTPIMRWDGTRAVWGMASGDFDGDGNLDVIFSRSEPRELVLLLGDGKGNFKRGKLDGVKLETLTNYDLKVADVNNDGRPDLIIAYESSSITAFSARDGSIHVFLNRSGEPKTKGSGKGSAKGKTKGK